MFYKSDEKVKLEMKVSNLCYFFIRQCFYVLLQNKCMLGYYIYEQHTNIRKNDNNQIS